MEWVNSLTTEKKDKWKVTQRWKHDWTFYSNRFILLNHRQRLQWICLLDLSNQSLLFRANVVEANGIVRLVKRKTDKKIMMNVFPLLLLVVMVVVVLLPKTGRFNYFRHTFEVVDIGTPLHSLGSVNGVKLSAFPLHHRCDGCKAFVVVQ